MSPRKTIQVFEYASLTHGETYNGLLFKESHYHALIKFNELHDGNYFSIGHRKITFKNFVGVLQVDGLTIEILPKVDKYEEDSEENKSKWQNALIEMLRVTKRLKVQKVGNAYVSKQSIHLLDIYFEWFLNEVQLLLHQGLIKQYYKETSNVKALKGKLEFAGHISKNLVHKERFYTTHQVYEKDHLIHQILYKALDIVSKCSKGNYLYSRCKSIQEDFPEVKNLTVTAATFTKIQKNRKTAPYETALAIARLIILNYAPNIKSGSEDMLALLFDMNLLWEEYILLKIKQAAEEKGVNVYGQNSKTFWQNISIRPDIVIEKDKQTFIIDTKWKNIDYSEPSTNDLRQMYVYNEYWNSKKAMLLYPSNEIIEINDDSFISFEKTSQKSNHHKCCLGKISIFDTDNNMDENIGVKILKWFDEIPPLSE